MKRPFEISFSLFNLFSFSDTICKWVSANSLIKEGKEDDRQDVLSFRSLYPKPIPFGGRKARRKNIFKWKKLIYFVYSEEIKWSIWPSNQPPKVLE